ncbi:capsular exopolysaccharide family [Paenibacillus sp. 1_12]|uniref:CpsD/CapB family tyrosine-protein kinase n=1 Tax=Paenibacillus sp. 1_12 TaxID=1566278 RepID=UPI0008EE893A|nr:CpsD/CapB family tyrosine-protein kinase [Paenibacillus sp. 1_12]SFL15775.1 capsular exopolysaccharide family [Paenibacillus sp. 1_12]
MVQTIGNPSIVMLSNPNSHISEMYRTLRFNIECMDAEHKVKIIAITSANQGEGKTTTAINLAIAFAKAGKKVLLVDANLRNPAFQREFTSVVKGNSEGLTNIIMDNKEMGELVQQSDIENLFILMSGSLEQNASDILSSKKMEALLVEMKSNFEIVLIDTPSMLKLTDAKIVSSMCDGVLLVVEEGKIKRAAAQEVKEELAKVRANLLGVVMNRTKK